LASVYKNIVLCFFIIISVPAWASDSLLWKSFKLMEQDKVLLSVRKQGKKEYIDNTIFFSLVVLYGIEQYKEELNGALKKEFDTRKAALKEQLPLYTNLYRATINFWQTQPLNQWPGNKNWANKKQRHIPDDFDDNVYARMLYKDEEADKLLCNLLEEKRNGSEYWAKNLPDSLRKQEVYNTWIGKKMPKEIDLVVLSNILLYKRDKNISRTDSLSLKYIARTYKSAKKWKDGKVLSPQYARYSTVLYHLTRLKLVYPKWEVSTEELLDELKSIDTVGMDLIEKVVIANSIIKLGGNYEINIGEWSGKSDYSFFYANAGSVFAKPLNKIISSIPRYFMPYYCEGLNYFLLWEYSHLKTKKGL